MRKLKNILAVVVLFAAATILVGCGAKKGLVGTWQYKDSSTFAYTFNEDGTGDYSGMKFTYKTEGSKLSIQYENSTEPFETTYEIKGNELNIKDSFGEDTIYVRK